MPSAVQAVPPDVDHDAALGALLSRAFEARSVAVVQSRRLSGGAIQENRLLELEIDGGPNPGRRRVVLRTDAPSGLVLSLTRAQEFTVLSVAHTVQVMVPEPILLCEDMGVIGAVFYVMKFVEGEARGRRLVRDPFVRARGEELVADAARELAKVHSVTPPHSDLAFLAPASSAIGLARIEELRALLDTLSTPQPVLEWGLRWLERHRPAEGDVVLTHSDFRTGNLLVREGCLAAVLDWEFARWGDRREDLGWFLAKCWRFGAVEREAGGLGSRHAFLDAYEAASGSAIPRDDLGWFEILATIRWATIALLQVDRHVSGRQSSLELALTAHVVPPLELDVLELIDWITRRITV